MLSNRLRARHLLLEFGCIVYHLQKFQKKIETTKKKGEGGLYEKVLIIVGIFCTEKETLASATNGASFGACFLLPSRRFGL